MTIHGCDGRWLARRRWCRGGDEPCQIAQRDTVCVCRIDSPISIVEKGVDIARVVVDVGVVTDGCVFCDGCCECGGEVVDVCGHTVGFVCEDVSDSRVVDTLKDCVLVVGLYNCGVDFCCCCGQVGVCCPVARICTQQGCESLPCAGGGGEEVDSES